MSELPKYTVRESSKARRYHLEMDWNDGLIVVVPKRWNLAYVEHLLRAKISWIEKHIRMLAKEKTETNNVLIPAVSKIEAKRIFLSETQAMAKIMGLTFQRVILRKQKTRWGSCSSIGNLNFNLHLILAPQHVRRSVIVHELAHRLVPNHSKRFWRIVELYCPDYKECRAWLRKNGRMLTNGLL